MPLEIPDLWPPEVAQVNVLTPLLILRHQAGLLRQRSSNVLEADVVTEQNNHGRWNVCHSLDLVVPALDRLQVRLLNVRHNKVMVYPAHLNEADFATVSRETCSNSQSEFIQKLGNVLRSDDVRSVIESLLAQANEVTTDVAPL